MKSILIVGLFALWFVGIVFAIREPNYEVKRIIDNRGRGYTTIEVKPAKRFEDCLQCSAGGRNVQNTVDGKYLQNGQTATHIDEVIPRVIITGEF